VDTCLAIRADGTFPLAAHVWFADVDWAMGRRRSAAGLQWAPH
jgi:hypothetical protein